MVETPSQESTPARPAREGLLVCGDVLRIREGDLIQPFLASER